MFTEYLTVPGTKCLKNTIPLTKKKVTVIISPYGWGSQSTERFRNLPPLSRSTIHTQCDSVSWSTTPVALSMDVHMGPVISLYEG